MQAVPPEGPLHRDDREPEPGWLEEPPADSAVDDAGNRRRPAMPTLVLVVAVVLIVVVALILVL